MEKYKFSNEIVSLKISANRLCWGREKSCKFTLKDDILFLVGERNLHYPKELIFELCVAKSNIALLCTSLCKENLLVKRKDVRNKKEIGYYITDKGEKVLEQKLLEIEKLKPEMCKLEDIYAVNKKLEGIK